MKPVKTLMIAGVAAFSSHALALPPWDAQPTGTIDLVEIYHDGSFAVTLAGQANLCNPATFPNYAEATPGQLGVTMEGAKNMLAVALSAKLTSRTVTLFLNNNSGGACKLGAITMMP